MSVCDLIALILLGGLDILVIVLLTLVAYKDRR